MSRKVCAAAAATVLALLCAWSVSAEEITVTGQDQQAVNVTIYTNNLALVKDRHTVSLDQGRQNLAFREVSAQIKPETARLYGPGVEVLEQNFEYDLLSPESLLRKYVGREVTLMRRNTATGAEQPVPATVLSAGGGMVLRVDGRIEPVPEGRLVYPDVPRNLRDLPTLTMLVENQDAGAKTVELSYLTEGLSWHADYVAELNPGDDRLALQGWVTLSNESGARYPEAALQLVAGDVHRVGPQRPAMLKREIREMAVYAAEGRKMVEESMFEYHLYSLERPTSIEDNQSKQVRLLQAEAVPCRKELLLEGRSGCYRSSCGVIGKNRKAGVFVELDNTREGGLGLPLPAGVVRMYKQDSRGGLQFVGEDRIRHTAEQETVRLFLGEAFDVTADTVQTAFNKKKQPDGEGFVYVSAYEVELRNAKAEPVTVRVRESFPAGWEILESSLPHHQENAQTVSWLVSVPARQNLTLTYQVRVTD